MKAHPMALLDSQRAAHLRPVRFKRRLEVLAVDADGEPITHQSRLTKSPLAHRRAKRRAQRRAA